MAEILGYDVVTPAWLEPGDKITVNQGPMEIKSIKMTDFGSEVTLVNGNVIHNVHGEYVEVQVTSENQKRLFDIIELEASLD